MVVHKVVLDRCCQGSKQIMIWTAVNRMGDEHKHGLKMAFLLLI